MKAMWCPVVIFDLVGVLCICLAVERFFCFCVPAAAGLFVYFSCCELLRACFRCAVRALALFFSWTDPVTQQQLFNSPTWRNLAKNVSWIIYKICSHKKTNKIANATQTTNSITTVLFVLILTDPSWQVHCALFADLILISRHVVTISLVKSFCLNSSTTKTSVQCEQQFQISKLSWVYWTNWFETMVCVSADIYRRCHEQNLRKMQKVKLEVNHAF